MNPGLSNNGGEDTDMPMMPDNDGDELSAGGVQAVPLSFLAQPDEGDQMQTPQQGDTVTLTVDATVVKIEGDIAYIKPSAINGAALDEQQTPTPETPGADDTEDSLRAAMAGQEQ